MGGVTAVFGGAFDPVHLGHIKPIFELLEQPEIERVIFVPCKLHPGKGCIGSADDDRHRLAMLDLVVRAPRMAVDTREMHAGETSYTVDTLRSFRSELGADAPLAFVLGEDAFNGVAGWRDYRRLPELAHLIVTRRPDCAGADVEAPADHPLVGVSGGYVPLGELAHDPAGKVCRFGNEPVAVSSSEVRKLLEAGCQPRYLVPGTVWSYIRRNRLYGCRDVPNGG